MKQIIIISALFVFCMALSVCADQAETLDAAKKLSDKTGMPILMEFVHTD